MDARQLGDIFVFVGAVSGSVFMLAYSLLAPWWRSEMGRHIMAFTASIALTFDYVSYRLIYPAHKPEYDIRACIFGVISSMLVWRLWMLVREQLIYKPGKETKHAKRIRPKQRNSAR